MSKNQILDSFQHRSIHFIYPFDILNGTKWNMQLCNLIDSREAHVTWRTWYQNLTRHCLTKEVTIVVEGHSNDKFYLCCLGKCLEQPNKISHPCRWKEPTFGVPLVSTLFIFKKLFYPLICLDCWSRNKVPQLLNLLCLALVHTWFMR